MSVKGSGPFSALLATGCGALLLTGLLVPESSSGESHPLLSIPELMKEVRKVQRADFEAWARFSFSRRVLRQRLDETGRIEKSEELEFRVTPVSAGFDELLVALDGRSALPAEVREHRRAARFEKHYGRVRAGQDVDEAEGFSLAWLTDFPDYELSGLDRVNGRPCYRLEFDPSRIEKGTGRATRVPQRFLAVMTGSLCVDRDTFHLVSAEMRTLEPVPLTFGLARILGLEVGLEGRPVTEKVWLPFKITVGSHLSILGREIRKKNEFTYSDYRMVDREAIPKDADSPRG